MAYALRADLTTFSLPSGALTNVSTAKQDEALEAASRIADGYLNVRYRLPLTDYGSDLKKAVCDIAALMLMRGRGFSPESADGDLLVSGEKAAIKWLEGIAAGKVTPYGLVDSSPSAANVEDAGVDRSPFVVQVHEGEAETDDFWSGTSNGSSGGVGPPRRRGW